MAEVTEKNVTPDIVGRFLVARATEDAVLNFTIEAHVPLEGTASPDPEVKFDVTYDDGQ